MTKVFYVPGDIEIRAPHSKTPLADLAATIDDDSISVTLGSRRYHRGPRALVVNGTPIAPVCRDALASQARTRTPRSLAARRLACLGAAARRLACCMLDVGRGAVWNLKLT